MLWSDLNECVACTQMLGMWHSMQPLDELTGQARSCPGAVEWQARHLASLRVDEVSAFVWGSWQVTQFSFPPLSV